MRAARLLWAKLVKQFEPASDKSLSLRTHCQTSGWSLTAQDVFNNVVRTCVEAMAATQGHTQSLHTNALDEALALPTDFSARIARNTQLLLQQESGTCRVIDPWGGSYYVERLTHDLAARAWAHIQEVEEAGGMTAAIEAGIPKLRIEEAAAQDAGAHRLRPPAGDRRQHVPARHGRRDRRAEGRQQRRARPAAGQARAAARRARRGGVRRRARPADGRGPGVGRRHAWRLASTQNLLKLSIDAARAHATVGEISAALEEVFGRHTAAIRTITGVYRSEVGEAPNVAKVRALVDEFAEAHGRRPRILVAKMGQDGHDRGQKVIATAFADLGFDVDVGPLFQTPGGGRPPGRRGRRPRRRRVDLAAGHLTLVPQLKAALARARPRRRPHRRRRRRPAAGLRRPPRGRRGGDLPARHRHRRRRGRAARRAARLNVRQPTSTTTRPASSPPTGRRSGGRSRSSSRPAPTTRRRPRSCWCACSPTPAAPTASASPACPAPASRRSSTPSAAT